MFCENRTSFFVFRLKNLPERRMGGMHMYDLDLLEHTDTVNELLARYGVKFGIYKNNEFKEQLFPFDAIPRKIEK